MINDVYIEGRVVADPVIRDLGNSSVVGFTVAINEKRGEQEYTEFVPVSWFLRDSERARGMKKGNQVMLKGKLQTKSYEDKNGFKQSKTEVIALMVRWYPKPSEAFV